MKKIILVLIIHTFYIAGFGQDPVQPAGLTPQDDQDAFLEMKIYPNPCKLNKVTVESFSNLITQISITNIAGKQVFLKKYPYAENKEQLELTNIPNGIYLVKIKTDDDKQVVKKLIVSKE